MIETNQEETKKIELIPGTYDFMFKAIMLDKDNKDYLIGIISHVTGIKKEDLVSIEVQNVEHTVNNKKDKKLRSDVIVSIGNNIINLEMNKDYYDGVFLKNDAYMHKISSSLYKEKEDYIDVKKVIQINFNNFSYFKENKEIYKFMYMEESTNIVLPENPIKYYIDLEYMYQTCYNKSVEDLSEFERYCLLLKAEEREFAKTIAGDDSIMKKIKEKIEELNEDDNILGLYDAEEEARRVWNTKIKYAEKIGEERGMERGIKKGIEKGIEQGIEKGLEKGIEQGIKEEKQEIARNMLLANESIDKIVLYTGLTKEEIEELNK